MTEWLRKIQKEISRKTEGMNQSQKWEYIFTYYWYHILLIVLGIGIFVLLVRHLFFQKPPKEFVCVMINQAIRYERDEMLQEEFSKILKVPSDRVLIDSDYVFSYEGKQLEGANESSYEKFFFRWAVKELDAVVMPESFYRHCRELEYEFMDLDFLLTEEEITLWKKQMLFEDGRYKGLYLSDSYFMSYLNQEEEDPLLLVFLTGETHLKAKQKFLKFAMGTETGTMEGVNKKNEKYEN